MIDATERVRQHAECSVKRDELARRAIQLFADGNDEAGMEAAEAAELWALRAMALEPGNEPPRRNIWD